MDEQKQLQEENKVMNGGRQCACEGGTLVRFVQPLLLSLLAKGPCHGYDLLQKISATRMWGENPPDNSGVYRVLREMEKKGLVTSEIVHEHNVGLGRKVYSLTEEGASCRGRWLTTLQKYQQDLTEVIDMLSE
ncbi:MAG: PadR family transcriptional regulator [Lachnospiraceae bacterium]|nr:PadR family transcriptional regulator [Lachnospiraceae bacterium]